MNNLEEMELLKSLLNEELSLESQIAVLYEVLENVLDVGAVRARTVKHKLQKKVASSNMNERLYALNKIASDGRGLKSVPKDEELGEAIDDTCFWISQSIAKRFVQNKIEAKVEENVMQKQEKYLDEIRLSIIKKQKGHENNKTLKKYEELVSLDEKIVPKNIMSILRPEELDEIVGQERAIKSLLAKLSSPYPQHIILYGPPGVGKTTAARIALKYAKKLKYSPFDEDSKFVEVDGTTLRWDPREITNPLLGSVHDPIYQGSKRDLADVGVPEPKPGLVTEAHGGILFIDEIGELESLLQNKLLKVLEDKRVEFSSSYYDPDDEATPKYIKYLFENGAPADFVLIGATTRDPKDINPALRSRCTEVYFEPLSSTDIEQIIINAAKKLGVSLEDGVAKLISSYTIEGRKAVNMLTDSYGYALIDADSNENITITLKDIREVIKTGRYVPYEKPNGEVEKEVGHIYGLGVAGFLGSTLEIEASVFKAKKEGTGKIRVNSKSGDMIKDSVFNAASVIRKITEMDITDYDVHVNMVGGGNVDGPSAGAAITVCIISALLNKPLRQDVAITGEISLRGKVKAIGGVFEKIYAARRKGVKTVIIPKENENDVPSNLTDIEVVTVDTIEELIDVVF